MLENNGTKNTLMNNTGIQTLDDAMFNACRFQAVPEHISSDLNGESVILSLKNGKYYGLNSVAATIWRALQFPSALAEIEVLVMKEYEVSADVCRQKVSSFLREMTKEGLVRILDEKPF